MACSRVNFTFLLYLIQYLWILIIQLDLCYPWGVYNFEVAARFLENVFSRGIACTDIKLYVLSFPCIMGPISC
jgi:hypothetical protein